MLVNKRRKRRTRRAMPAGLKRYWATHRRGRRHNPNPKRRRRVRVAHYTVNRRRTHARRYRRNPGGVAAVPSSVGGFLSTRFLGQAGAVVVGAMVPGLVTDRLLPMVGLSLTGLPRRLAQAAVPLGVVLFGGKRLLGGYAAPFVLGAGAAVLVGVVNDFAPGLLPTSPLAGLAGPGMGRYALPPAGVSGVPALGRYSPMPKVLATR